MLGEEHPDTLTSMNDLGEFLRAQGKLSEAERQTRAALDNRRRVLGEDDLDTLTSISNLGLVLHELGKLGEAERYEREAVEKSRRVLGGASRYPDLDQQPRRAAPGAGQAERSGALLSRNIGRERRVREEHPDTLTSTGNLGYLLLAQGKLVEAEQYARETLEKSRRVIGEEHVNTLFAVHNMGAVLVARGKHAEAVRVLVPFDAPTRKLFADNPRRLAVFLEILGKAFVGLQEFPAAERNLLEVYPLFVQTAAAHSETRECIRDIVNLYTAWNAVTRMTSKRRSGSGS